MINLNIIPLSKKKEIYKIEIYFLVIILLFFTLISFIVGGYLLFKSKQLINNTYQINLNTIELINKNNQTKEKDLSKYSSIVNQANIVQRSYIPWSKLLITLNETTPENINLKNLNIDFTSNEKNYLIKLSGVSKNRNDLIDYKNILEKNNIFNNIVFPVSNLLEKQNSKFEITADLNIQELQF